MNPKIPMTAVTLVLLLIGAPPQVLAEPGAKGKPCPQHQGYRSQAPLHAEHWRATLTDEQQAALDRLRVAYVRNTVPMKVRMQSVKAELAEMTAADGFDLQQIEGKIDQYLLLKREKMLLKLKYLSEKRDVLTPEQRMSFDMDTMLKARQGQR